MDRFFDKMYGCLVAGLIGDAMGAPVENKTYEQIEAAYGEVADFEGSGTDDSAIKLILCETILRNNGYVTADEFAEGFLRNRDKYDFFYVPVRNAFHKVDSRTALPVYAGLGNMPSSSSAMAISPMGLLNACNPRQAAMETYDVAGLIHGGETSTFCRDGASAMAAAVAEAMKVDATVESVAHAATAYLHKTSSAEMVGYIERAFALARETGEYKAFRKAYYAANRQTITCDSRETVSCAFALFHLAGGDPNKAVSYGANYGRDADTIATMAGALSGALQGASAIRPEWLRKVETHNRGQKELARRMMDVALRKAADATGHIESLRTLSAK